MKIKRVIIILIALSFILSSSFGLTGSFAETSGTSQGDSSASDAAGVKDQNAGQETGDNESLKKMKVVGETDFLLLYLNHDTTEFAVVNKSTNDVFYSNPVDWSKDSKANDEVKETMASQISLEFYDPLSTPDTMNSFTDCIAYKQFEIKKIDNGVKVIYTIGKLDARRLLPKILTRKTFEEKILNKATTDKAKRKLKSNYALNSLSEMDEDEKKKMLGELPILEQTDVYLLRNISERTAEELESYIIPTGFTFEEMEEEARITGFESVDEKKAVFVIPVEYKLEDDTFVARIISEEISATEGYPLYKLAFLQYFGAADQNEPGYMLVPDGSGALIELNKRKNHVQAYAQQVYGEDEAIARYEKKVYSEQVVMPVFGMKQRDKGFFAIIEEGEPIAGILASTSGNINSYNNVYAEFTMTDRDYLRFNNLRRQEGIFIFPPRASKGNITIRYALLKKDEADYVGMAKYYQNYLINKNTISKLSPKDNIPFYLDLVGAIDKRKTILGIPVKSFAALTTYTQAIDMMEELSNKGVGNIKLRYLGWFNGGLSHYEVSSIKLQKELGGKRDFTRLVDYMKKMNFEFYPDVDFMYVHLDKLFDGFNSKRDTSRFINRKVATVTDYDEAAKFMYRTWKLRYLVSPSRLQYFIDGFLSEYKKLSNNAISLGNMGSKVNSNFKADELTDRTQALGYLTKGIKSVNDAGYQVMVDCGNAATLPYVKSILNLPMDSSKFAVEDEGIPFYQMVLHGYIEYAGEPINTAQDYRRNLLKSIETGSGIYYKWIHNEDIILNKTDHDDLYSLYYGNWFDEAVSLYGKVNEILKDVQDERIINHQKLAENVYQTTYENGKLIVVNYNKQPVDINGVKINAEDFCVLEGGN